MTSKLSAKIFEMFKHLKSDAVPKAPREDPFSETNASPQNDNEDYSNRQEEVHEEMDDVKKSKKKPKYKKSFSEPNTDTGDFLDDDDRRSSNASSNVHTQATGNVINIVNSNNVRWGNEFVYYMGNVHGQPGQQKQSKSSDDDDDDEDVKKTNLIILLLEASTKPEHEYIDYISKNLGKNWHSFFRKLGYKQGRIETVEIDMAKHGIAEVRYKLLLDWIRNDNDGTLGRLATVLWESGKRPIVKELAAMYSKD